MRSYQELTVWQKSRNLVKMVYSLTKTFPQSELYSLTNQLNRCAISVPSNIAEGWTRHSTKDFINFLYISRGSLAELDMQLILANDLGYLSADQLTTTQEQTLEINKMLSSAIWKLKNKVDTKTLTAKC